MADSRSLGTTLQVLARAAQTWPEHPAIEDSDRTLSFSALAAEVEEAAVEEAEAGD